MWRYDAVIRVRVIKHSDLDAVYLCTYCWCCESFFASTHRVVTFRSTRSFYSSFVGTSCTLEFVEILGFCSALTTFFTYFLKACVGLTSVRRFFRNPYSASTREYFLLCSTLFLFSFGFTFGPRSCEWGDGLPEQVFAVPR